MNVKLLIGILGVCTLFTNSALANKVERCTLTAPSGFTHAPDIEVYSTNGKWYTTVDKTDKSKVTVKLSAKCKWEGKGNKAYRGRFTVPGYVAVGATKPANYLIPHSKEASGVFRYDTGKGQSINPVKVCNDHLKKLLSQSTTKTKYHFMAKGFKVKFPAAIKATYALTCKPTGAGFTDSSTKSVMVNATISCKSSAKAQQKIPK